MNDRNTLQCLSGHFDLISTIIKFHPYLLKKNLKYNRNFFSILKAAPKLIEELDPVNLHLSISESKFKGIKYISDTNYSYDDNLVNTFKRELTNQIDLLKKYELDTFTSIKNDIFWLKKTIFSRSTTDLTKATKKAFLALIKLSPLTYNSDGSAHISKLDELATKFDNIEIEELDNYYRDFFPESLAPIFISLADNKGFGQLNDITLSILNNFIKRDAAETFKIFNTSKKSIKTREIYFTEVPNSIAIFRGVLGGDCSLMSIPFYPILNSSRTYWIYKDQNTKSPPIGYIFFTEINLDGKTIPYILTINGVGITTNIAHATIKFVVSMYETEEYLLAGDTIRPNLVNSQQIYEAFNTFGGDSVSVDMPNGWETVSLFTELNRDGYSDYSNYYSTENLQIALQVKNKSSVYIEPLKTTETLTIPYDLQKTENLEVFDRSMLAAYANNTYQNETKLILNITNTTKEQLRVSEDYITNRPFSNFSSYIKYFEVFNLNHNDLLNFDITFLLPLLEEIFDYYEDKAPEDFKIKFARKAKIAIDQELLTGPFDNSDNLYGYKLSLPDSYIPNYWDEIKECLRTKDKRFYDYYRINRYIKKFKSYNSIKKILWTVENENEFLECIDTESPHWISFFQRALYLVEDQDVKKIIDSVYQPKIKEAPEKYKKLYEEIFLNRACN